MSSAAAVDPATLAPNFYVDSDHPAVVAFAGAHGHGRSPREVAVALFYAIRDGFRYNPWRVKRVPAAFRASTLLTRDRAEGGHCIDKANLLAACARVHGIPSRLHFADVRNHIGTARLEQRLGTDRLVFHGYTELFLDGRWVAATPAFNVELCTRLGVAPLDFDGVHDAIFQEFDPAAGRFMEYLEDRGAFPDIPFDAMIAAWNRHYPGFATGGWPAP